MSDATKPVFLTSKDLAARWGVSDGMISGMRDRLSGPAWFRPSGAESGKILYRLDLVEEYERGMWTK